MGSDMEGQSEPAVKRKPVQTSYMRRDSEHNPEYLDAERALVRFSPLIENLMRKLRPWHSRYGSSQDMEDLRSIIQTEFLWLHYKYDPAYGVDFPGYIKMNLERRVRYCISRDHKKLGNEVLAFASDVTGNYMESLPDEKAEQEMNRVDFLASIPIEALEDAAHREIIRQVVEEKADIYTLAHRYNISPRSMAARIEAAGRYARSVMQMQETKSKRERQDDQENLGK